MHILKKIAAVLGVFTFLASSTALGIASQKEGTNSDYPGSQYKDRFGGNVRVQGAKTGRWHLEVIGDQSTFVDPDGNSWTAMGLNKMATHNIYDEDFEEKFETKKVWAEQTVQLVKSELQFNLIGHYSDLDALVKPGVSRMPYTVTPKLFEEEPAEREPSDYPDPWSAEFAADADRSFQLISMKYDRDPYFAFVFLGNENNEGLQLWDGQPNTFALWPRILPDALGRTPAKEVWVALYRDTLYNGDLAEFNRVHGKSLASWDEMYDEGTKVYSEVWAGFADPQLLSDSAMEPGRAFDEYRAWSDAIHIQYAKVASEASRRFMPDRLIGSSKMRGNDRMTENVVRGIGQYVDFMALNDYRFEPDAARYDWVTSVTGKPVLVSESGILEEPCNGPYPGVPTEEERATAWLAFRDAALKRHNVLGVIDHEYSDPHADTPCGYLTFGIVDRHGEAYEAMIETGKATWKNYDDVRWGVDTFVYVPAEGRDSDDDGYPDAVERANGYNPFGKGKLK